MVSSVPDVAFCTAFEALARLFLLRGVVYTGRLATADMSARRLGKGRVADCEQPGLTRQRLSKGQQPGFTKSYQGPSFDKDFDLSVFTIWSQWYSSQFG